MILTEAGAGGRSLLSLLRRRETDICTAFVFHSNSQFSPMPFPAASRLHSLTLSGVHQRLCGVEAMQVINREVPCWVFMALSLGIAPF